MRRIIMATMLILLIFFLNLPLGAADETFLKSKSDDGSILILADGSVWEVSAVDRVDSALWLPTEDIIIPDSGDCLINKDNGEKVDARRVR